MLRLRGPAVLRKTICFPASDRGAHVTLPHIDGEIRGGRRHMQVRVYYEDTDLIVACISETSAAPLAHGRGQRRGGIAAKPPAGAGERATSC